MDKFYKAIPTNELRPFEKKCPECGVRCQYGHKAVSGHQYVFFKRFDGYDCIFCRLEFK